VKQQKRSPSQAIAALQGRNSLSVGVAGRLREASLSGRFPPGERLREIPLATMLGVSRGPVREALLRRRTKRLVVTERHRARPWPPLTDQNGFEVRSLRLALERLDGSAGGAHRIGAGPAVAAAPPARVRDSPEHCGEGISRRRSPGEPAGHDGLTQAAGDTHRQTIPSLQRCDCLDGLALLLFH